MRGWWLGLVALGLALTCVYLPWYVHSTAAFTLHAYDLAEWASLHPAVRAESPALLTSLLLRLPQVALVLVAAILANGGRDARLRVVIRGVALLVALRYLPPREFFGSAIADPNYRQMAILSAVGVGGVVLAATGRRVPPRWQITVAVGVLFIGVIAGWWGLWRAYPLLDNFQIDVRIGSGAVGYSIFCAVAAGAMLFGGRVHESALPASGRGKQKRRLTDVNRLLG